MLSLIDIVSLSVFGIALVWIILDDSDSKAIEEYIRKNPEEFRRYKSF